MAIHKQILEWQAAHPNITWIGWGIVWAIVLAPVLASTSFGVTKVVRELPHFKWKLIWPFLASVMRPQALAP
jgi:hypothetical protein